MIDLTKLFWNAGLNDIKRGYVYEPPSGEFICLCCGENFAQGRIYQSGGMLFEAEKAVQIHLEREHGSVFEFLLRMDKKYTGLTDHQRNLLRYFFQGLSDKEIAARIESDNTSTIRNHRFSLREKAKQAKIFLAIMELLEEHSTGAEQFVEIPRTTVMVDQRFAVTKQEGAAIIKTYFKDGPDGPLSTLPTKEKRKVVVLQHLLRRFEPRRQYTEREVNSILKQAYPDYVTLRRYLIEYGFLDRRPDGSLYWVKS